MNKLINRFYIKAILVLFFSIMSLRNYGQQTILNHYGLHVIASKAEYLRSVSKDPAKEMVDIKAIIPRIVFDLRYTGKNNFTKTKLYPSLKTSYLRTRVANDLLKVQTELMKEGLGLKIFDAYRPYSVTEKMWVLVNDDRYAADPKNGSGHNRGIAVDLTLINIKTKEAVDMGTDFDNFSDTAHQNFMALPEKVLQKRILLKELMEKNGFKSLATEWWHYSFIDGTSYELMDIDFKNFQKR